MTTTLNQTKKMHNLSFKYLFTSSNEIVRQLSQSGWNLRSHKQKGVRNVEKQGFQYHVMRFDNPKFKVDDDNIEIIVTNSHDGTSALRMELGIFRIVCANGLTVGRSFNSVQIRHITTNKDEINKGLTKLLAQTNKLNLFIQEFKNKTIDSLTRYTILNKIFNSNEGKIYDLNLVQPLRSEDIGTDAWRFFNVVQEHAMSGGIRYTKNGKFNSTRKIKDIKKANLINNLIIDTFVDTLDLNK